MTFRTTPEPQLRPHRIAMVILAAGASHAPAVAQSVNFFGNVLNSCILTLSLPGALAMSADGTTLSSDQAGGNAATLTMVATGSSPTLLFTAPGFTSTPAAYSGAPSVSVRYTSVRGTNQPWTSGASSASPGFLLDTFTVHARAIDMTGFRAGAYTLATVATCQQ